MSEQNNGNGVMDFLIGGQLRTLKFTAATRYRLFLNIETQDIQAYISSDAFKISATGMLIFGKEIIGKPLADVLDMFDEVGLTDDEMEEIVGWVRKRTLNFMLKEAEQIAEALNQSLPQAIGLNNTLTGLQTSALPK